MILQGIPQVRAGLGYHIAAEAVHDAPAGNPSLPLARTVHLVRFAHLDVKCEYDASIDPF